MRDIDRTRLAEAFRLADSVGDKVWPGWSKAPFAVLLVTPENEFLIRHPQPSKDFTPLGFDAVLKSDVYFRKRTQPPNFLATFPLVGGISTIVVGQAENTQAKTSTPWVVTLLHEHFHQLQDSGPGYYAAINALDLANGDETGMWQLNYPFPYAKPEIDSEFNTLSKMMLKALRAGSRPQFRARLGEYLNARRQFQKRLAPADYRYLSFQLWKEGVSRYTEYVVAQLAARKYKPGREFAALADYKPYAEVRDKLMANILRQLETQSLAGSKREIFYPFGAGEALLLDRAKPEWRKRYFTDRFHMAEHFGEETAAHSGLRVK
jgi:hypothetical protein